MTVSFFRLLSARSCMFVVLLAAATPAAAEPAVSEPAATLVPVAVLPVPDRAAEGAVARPGGPAGERGRVADGRGAAQLAEPAAPSRKFSSCRDRTGCWSFFTALASICRTRSRVTRKIRPTSSSV